MGRHRGGGTRATRRQGSAIPARITTGTAMLLGGGTRVSPVGTTRYERVAGSTVAVVERVDPRGVRGQRFLIQYEHLNGRRARAWVDASELR